MNLRQIDIDTNWIDSIFRTKKKGDVICLNKEHDVINKIINKITD